MAIWDVKPQEEITVTSSADTHKCPGCSSNLVFNQKSGQLVCNSCGQKYYPEFFEISNMLSKIDSETNTDDDDKNLKHEIVCNSCGSTVVTDNNTAATFCAFCGSPALVTNRLTKSFKPDYIVPFKLTREDAKEKFKEWASTKKFLPKKFTSEANLKKMTGLYVPFWLIDADCHIDFDGGAVKEDKDTYYDFAVKRKGSFKMHLVPFDGSKRINDRLMESIEPFDYNECVPFTTGYLPGYFAERYDLNTNDMAQRISDRFRDYMFEERSNFFVADRYSSFTVDYDRSFSDNYKCRYALMPIWFMNFEYEGLYYKIAINGQTGKIAGNAPMDSRKTAKTKYSKLLSGYAKILAVFLVFTAIASISQIVKNGGVFDSSILFFAGFFLVYTLIYTFAYAFSSGDDKLLSILDKVHLEANEEINEKTYEMPPARTYIDSRDKVTLEKEDKPIHVTPKALMKIENTNNKKFF